MLVIDEYIAVDVVVGDWPAMLPDDEPLGLPASRYFRLLQRIHNPAGGQLSSILDRLPEHDLQAIATRTPRSSKSSTPAHCSTRLQPSARAVVWLFRFLLFALPPVTAWGAYRLCKELQARDGVVAVGSAANG